MLALYKPREWIYTSKQVFARRDAGEGEDEADDAEAVKIPLVLLSHLPEEQQGHRDKHSDIGGAGYEPRVGAASNLGHEDEPHLL